MTRNELKRILLIAKKWYKECQNRESRYPIDDWRENFASLSDEIFPELKGMDLNYQGVEFLFMHLTNHIIMVEQREKENEVSWSFDAANANIPEIKKPDLRLIV